MKKDIVKPANKWRRLADKIADALLYDDEEDDDAD